MAIYNIFDYSDRAHVDGRHARDPFGIQETFAFYNEPPSQEESEKGHFFSVLAARFFFLLLFFADIAWGLYSLLAVVFKIGLCIITMFKMPAIMDSLAISWLGVKRSLVCGIALIVALFSPALGIMFSCMYFLMYDRDGVDEIVPASLRDQFSDFFPA